MSEGRRRGATPENDPSGGLLFSVREIPAFTLWPSNDNHVWRKHNEVRVHGLIIFKKTLLRPSNWEFTYSVDLQQIVNFLLSLSLLYPSQLKTGFVLLIGYACFFSHILQKLRQKVHPPFFFPAKKKKQTKNNWLEAKLSVDSKGLHWKKLKLKKDLINQTRCTASCLLKWSSGQSK